MTPIVIVHEDYQDYLKSSIEISGKNNKIYLIGNKSVEFLQDHPSVTYVNIQKYLKCMLNFITLVKSRLMLLI